MQKDGKSKSNFGGMAFDFAGGFSSEKSTPKVDPVVERINQSDLPKNLKDALLDYFHSPSAVNFVSLQGKITLLKGLTSKLISLKRYADWFQSLKKLSLIYGVIDYKGTAEQKSVLNSLELIKGILADLKSQSEKIAASDIQIIAQYWDQWFFSFLPDYLRANSYYSDRPESVCGLLSSYLLNSIIDQPSEFHERYQALKAVSIDLLQWKGKRVHLKAWLDPLFGMENESEKNKQAWIEHRAVQEVGWSAVLTDNVLAVLFAEDQALCHEIRVIQEIERELARIKSADYLKGPKEKDIHAIIQGMEAIADILVAEANPESRGRWCDDIIYSLVFYTGILETIKNPMWGMDTSSQKKIRGRIGKKIMAAENKLCRGVGVIQYPSPEKQKQSQQKLADYRTKARKRLEKLLSQKVNKDSEWLERAHNFRQFSDDVTQWVNSFLQELISSSIQALGPVPCSYAFVGLGSLEKNSTTSYSDIEFAIFISDNSEACKDYFRKLTYLLHAQVIQLGETPIAYSLFHYNFDAFTNTGFCFDLGGKISLGRYGEEEIHDQHYGQRKYELIETPEQMIRYIEDEWFAVDKLLPVELLSCSHITGDESLTKRYHSLLGQRYLQCDDSGKRFCERRAVTLLKGNRFLQGDLDQFGCNINDERDGMLVDVKKEVYRLPDRFIGDLALAVGIIGGSTAQKIDLLQTQGILSKEQAKELFIIYGIAQEIRLQTYFYYRAQKEKLSVMPKVFEKQKHYHLEDPMIMQRFYECAYPLTEIMKTFCEHLEKGGSRKESYKNCFEGKEIRSQDSGILARIAGRLGQAENKIKHLEKKLQVLESRAKVVKEGHYGPEHLELAVTLFNLGTAVATSLEHRKKKMSLLERALAIFERQYGPEHVAVAATLASLGNAYGAMGDYKKRVELQERALAIFESHYGPEHVMVAITLTDLGTAVGALGDFKKGVALMERALAIKERHYGPEHVDVARTLIYLGTAVYAVARTLVYWGNPLGAREEYIKSVELIVRAYMIEERHYGPEHKAVAATLGSLGNALGGLGDYKKQVELQERALAIRERHYGPEHMAVTATLVDLGKAYGDLGDYQKQVELQERALAIEERYYGLKHVTVTYTLGNLGNAYGALGDYKKQVELQRRALAIKERHYGPEHVDVAKTLWHLGCAYVKLGDYKKAVALQERALAIEERHYGPEHVEVASTLGNLGSAYGALGDYQKAVEYQQRALAIEERHYGPEHVQVAITLVNLGYAYLSREDDRSEGIALLERACKICGADGKQQCEVHAEALCYLGWGYGATGNVDKKKEYLEQALAWYDQRDKKTDPRKTVVLILLGQAPQDDELLKAAWLHQKRFNPQHPIVLEIEAAMRAHQKDRVPVNQENLPNDSTDKSESDTTSVARLLTAQGFIASGSSQQNSDIGSHLLGENQQNQYHK